MRLAHRCGVAAVLLGFLVAVTSDDLLSRHVVSVEICCDMRLQHHPIFENMESAAAFLHGNTNRIVCQNDLPEFDCEVIFVAAA